MASGKTYFEKRKNWMIANAKYLLRETLVQIEATVSEYAARVSPVSG